MTKLDQKQKVREEVRIKDNVKPKKAPKTKEKDKPMKEKRARHGLSISIQLSDASKFVVTHDGLLKKGTKDRHRLALFAKTNEANGKGALSLKKFLKNPSLCLYMYPVFASKKDAFEVSQLQAVGFEIIK